MGLKTAGLKANESQRLRYGSETSSHPPIRPKHKGEVSCVVRRRIRVSEQHRSFVFSGLNTKLNIEPISKPTRSNGKHCILIRGHVSNGWRHNCCAVIPCGGP